jgi:hypothetical protein
VHRFDLREAALALDEAPLKRLATELATVSALTSCSYRFPDCPT